MLSPPSNNFHLGLSKETREALWVKISEAIESYLNNLESYPIVPDFVDVPKIREFVKTFDFNQSADPFQVVDWAVEGLTKYHMHMSHPRHFGHFCPPASAMGIIADALVAGFNPQLATFRASPFSVECEQHLLRTFGALFGYETTYGHFTSCGSEANHTALICALANRFPEFREEGLIGSKSRPVVYVSTQAHECHARAAALCGLGTKFVRKIETTDSLQMDIGALASQIQEDRRNGLTPLMVVATAGTTNAGIVDPIDKISEIARREELWFHLDAAWGGAAILLPEFKELFQGSEKADSLLLDAHKWFSVPMGAGMFMTRHQGLLEKIFKFAVPFINLRRTGRVEGDETDYSYQSMQWSRRFIGLKLFLTLAVAGWEGYRELIKYQIQLGDLLRMELEGSGWKILNKTPLPVICFVDDQHLEGRRTSYLEKIAKKVVKSHEAWIFCTQFDADTAALRVCVVSYWSTEDDVHALVQALNKAREEVALD